MERRTFVRFASWIVVSGAALFTAIYLGILVLRDYDAIIREHFAATVGLPLAGIASFCIVYVLQHSSGAIEFEVLSLKFKGASGPIVFWVLCFLGMALAIKLLW